MIKIDCIYNQDKNIGYEHFAIMHSLRKNLNTPGMIQMSALAPSAELYHWFLQQKEDQQWTYAAFEQEYVPQFIKELRHNQYSINALQMLFDQSHTKNIALYCTCSYEEMCHRSIVGGILLGSGATIECNPEYAKYWEMFKQI